MTHQRGSGIEDWVFLLVATIAAGFAALVFSGCGGAALESQVRITHAVGGAFDEAGSIVEGQAADGITVCEQGAQSRAEGLACMDRVDARFAPMDRAYAVAARAYAAVVQAVLAEVAADNVGGVELGTWVALVEQMAKAYAALVEVAADIRLRLPALPGGLR